jgi:squalene-hopene/tetraprenyl-beta-curcumene cyclase
MNSHSSWLHKVERAVGKCSDFLFQTQHSEGYWWAELESNVTITSEYLMLFHLLGAVDPEREACMVKHLLREQRSDGSWGLYYGGDGDLSTAVEAYFALKLAGVDTDAEPLRRARDFILQRGGIESARVFTKIWLALFAQYAWDNIPTMPVEIVLCPPRMRFSIYEFSSWARSTVVPLSIVMALRPAQSPAPGRGVPELYAKPGRQAPRRAGVFNILSLFKTVDRFVKWLENHHPVPALRKKAMRVAEEWILSHQEASGDWGGIQPCMINSVLALYYLGYPLDHPAIGKGLEALKYFCFEDQEGLRLQSCISPVWDTALNCIALKAAGLSGSHPGLEKAASWLYENQIFTGGDWQYKNPSAPGGWAFEFDNSQYPDVDDSAIVLMALQGLDLPHSEETRAAKEKGIQWCLSMQSEDGGWAAFDKDNTLTILNKIPFGDHEAMVDYPTADITGRMLEVMGAFGLDRNHPRARRGLEFIKKAQEADGCWWGRWGVNYIYGTWSVLRGLRAIGEDLQAPYIRAAVNWLKGCQNPDGGWGETCESYRRPELRGQGPSTASQTAWALIALMAAGEEDSPEVYRGIGYLLRNQLPDGSWEEDYFTGTGFPKHFYIRYHNYRNCFPLAALGEYMEKLRKKGS